MASPPVLWDIESDPVLANVKLIAEAWDATGLYQVGGFVGDSWKEWNGKFRDDVRAFLKGDRDTVRPLACRLRGSPDIYDHEEREPEQSVNFVTCHDGFTLNDLVSFNSKHNEANGEANRDGSDYNLSWNCGAEGPTDDPAVERLRNRQVKNFLTLTLLATGTPMLLMGDEVRRTQRGNNNAYCQNNDTSWFDWSLVEKHADIHRFVRQLIAFRMVRDLPVARFGMTLSELLHEQPVEWHGVKLGAPDWGPDSHTLAACGRILGGKLVLHIMNNAYWEPLEFEVPPLGTGHQPWRRCVDTFLEVPEDICTWADAKVVDDSTYPVQPRSIVILVSKMRSGPDALYRRPQNSDRDHPETLMTEAELDELSINTIRTLSIDAVQAANSGHPGTPMALAPLVYTIWNRVMRFDPQDPIWPNRDRFVLSNGHASMLLWSVLHLTGTRAVNADYERLGSAVGDPRRHPPLPSARQQGPGSPRVSLGLRAWRPPPGPLGQGIATSVGMAIAQKWLASRYNRPGFDVFDYDIYAVCGDGCLMEGVGSEAASLAGHLGLDNLCWVYDNNHITIEGSTRDRLHGGRGGALSGLWLERAARGRRQRHRAHRARSASIPADQGAAHA